MAFEHYIQSGGKRLRCGYTTGTCAALAASAAVRFLLSGETLNEVSLTTPKGWSVTVPVCRAEMRGGTAVCAVQKDGGDDIDATNGLWIEAHVSKTKEPEISVDGGAGVGRVTKPGLDQPVGAAAINRVPRRMIEEEILGVCREFGYEGGIRAVICVPGGEQIAAKTFNPQLGIEGGISILGTSGIVEPMSVQALIDTVTLSLRQAKAQGARRVVLTPGNYGEDFLRTFAPASGVPVAKCSNFIGEALDEAAALEFEDVLLVGHAGKLVKLAGGIMNTHSRWADCRTELFCAHAAVCGAPREVCEELLHAATSDACLTILQQAGLCESVMKSLLDAIEVHLVRRAAGAYRVGAVLFTNEFGFLGQTESAARILADWRGQTT